MLKTTQFQFLYKKEKFHIIFRCAEKWFDEGWEHCPVCKTEAVKATPLYIDTSFINTILV